MRKLFVTIGVAVAIAVIGLGPKAFADTLPTVPSSNGGAVVTPGTICTGEGTTGPQTNCRPSVGAVLPPSGVIRPTTAVPVSTVQAAAPKQLPFTGSSNVVALVALATTLLLFGSACLRVSRQPVRPFN